VHSSFVPYARRALCAFLCAGAIFAAGCHRNNLTSGYGIAWFTLSDTPGDFTSYIVNVDSVTLTGKSVGAITAIAAVEKVDFTKLKNISELWSAASIPNDTYTSATITLDYTSANISVLVDGVPQQATVEAADGSPVTTVTVTLNFDPTNQLVILPTYATTDAQRVAVDFDLPASNTVDLSVSPAVVHVKPYMTIATSAPDNKPIRVRGPLINSNVPLGTYTVYVRPFQDEVDSLGSLTIFNGPDTIYSINGTAYTGAAGINVLSQLSAGSTLTAAYTTLQPTATPVAVAGKFNSLYIVAGSTLEDFYTEGLEGDVIARTGNTLTLRGATLVENAAEVSSYINTPDAVVLLGPGTIVTEDDTANFAGLNYQSISVGQHIIARGIYTLPASGVTTLDATGTSSTNTGSVRIQSTQLFGSLVSSASGSLVMDVQSINDWPISVFNFAGTGVSTAQDASPANYAVDTGTLALPAGTAAGTSLWVDGAVNAFGSAPPDFTATAVNTEATLQVAGGTTTCGQANFVCVPASLQVTWSGAGTASPFATFTDTGLTINLTSTNYSSGVIRIGPESIDLTSLPATPTITPLPPGPTGTPGAIGTAGLAAIFLPLFSVGNPTTASATTTTPTSGSTTTTATTALGMYNTYTAFVTAVNSNLSASNPALQFVATGVYNRTLNTFTASKIDLVL
jgi:hypothetical protein